MQEIEAAEAAKAKADAQEAAEEAKGPYVQGTQKINVANAGCAPIFQVYDTRIYQAGTEFETIEFEKPGERVLDILRNLDRGMSKKGSKTNHGQGWNLPERFRLRGEKIKREYQFTLHNPIGSEEKKQIQALAQTKRTEFVRTVRPYTTGLIACLGLVIVNFVSGPVKMVYNFAPVAAYFAKASGCFVEAVVNAAGDTNGELSPVCSVRISTG